MSLIVQSIKFVFKKPTYLLLAGLVAFITFFASIWLANHELFVQVVFSDYYRLEDKLAILSTSLGLIKTNFTPVTRTLVVLLSLLVGINIGLQLYYFKQRAVLQRSAGTSVAGTVIGFLGIGCASCGSVILSSVFGLSATASFLGFLPFKGLEFGFLGLVGLVWAIYAVSKKIQSPLICDPVEKDSQRSFSFLLLNKHNHIRTTFKAVIGITAFAGLAGGSYYLGSRLSGSASATTAAQPSHKEFNLVMENSQYNPSSIVVNQGDRVVLNITNRDPVDHAVGINEFNAQVPGGHLPPGQTTRLEFVASKKLSVDAALCGGPKPTDKTDSHGEELIINVI